MRLIDSHTHMHRDFILEILRIMDISGVEKVWNLSGEWGDRLKQNVRVFKKGNPDRFELFMNLDYSGLGSDGFEDWVTKEMESAKDQGVLGLKIFKELGLKDKDCTGKLIAVDDPRLDFIWEKAAELKMPVLIHTADPKPFFDPPTIDNERYEELLLRPQWRYYGDQFPKRDELFRQRDKVLERHPNTIFITAHVGGNPEDLKYVDSLLSRFPNVYTDFAARIGDLGRHPMQEVREFFIKFQDRILFGTDLSILPISGCRFTELFDGTYRYDGVYRVKINEASYRYDGYRKYLMTQARSFEYPGYPTQGRWFVDAIDLPFDVLEKICYLNALKIENYSRNGCI